MLINCHLFIGIKFGATGIESNNFILFSNPNFLFKLFNK